MDELMDAQMKTLDLSEREKYFNQVQDIMADQQPLIFTVTPIYYAAIRPGHWQRALHAIEFVPGDLERRAALL